MRSLLLSLRVGGLYVALFLSGAAALIYQTTWARMLHRVFGVGDLAIATVLAAFFLGLGLGSAVGGRLAQRFRRAALGYALLEVGIGLYALISLALIPNLHSLYAALGPDTSFAVLTAVRLVLALGILLPPTLLMGATLPVLVRAIANYQGNWSSPATWLYATNTFGAMAGAGATGLYLLPTVGTRASVILAAAASLTSAAIVASLWRAGGLTPSRSQLEDRTPTGNLRPPAIRLALVLASLAGFASLAGEVLWTRVLRIIVQGTTPAFSAMLVNYLFGIAVGGLLADRWVRRGISPTTLFGRTQFLLAGLTAVAMAGAPQLPRILGLLSGQAVLEPHETWPMLVVASLLLLPISLALGTSIPLAWHIAGGGSETAARHAGRVLAWNTLGGLGGSLLAGFFLIPTLGSEGSILLVAAVHALTAALAFRAAAQGRFGRRVLGLLGPAVLLAGVLLLRPSLELPFLLHARNDAVNGIVAGPGPAWRKPVVFFREGRNTTVTVVRGDDMLRLYNDGRPESGFGVGEPGFGAELVVLGALPTLFAERRDRAMVIGLGAGHTTSLLLAGPWQRIDVVELEHSVVEAARFIHKARDKPFPLDDPRTQLIVDDARAQLVLAAPQTYDAIVSQPSHPWLAGSSALYTHEFFEEARRALRPGGVVALWVNLFRTDVRHLRSVVATLTDVFPYAQAFVVEDSSFVLCASYRPIPIDNRVSRRMATADLQAFLLPHQLSELEDLAAVRELESSALIAFGKGAPHVIDDRPSLEFDLARTPAASTVTGHDLDRAARKLPWITPESYRALPPPARAGTLLARTHEVSARSNGLHRLEQSLEPLRLDAKDRAWIQGTLSEVRGDIRGALTAYDGAETPQTAYAADQLRLAERMYGQLWEAAEIRHTPPESARPLLVSALALGEPDRVQRAVQVGQRADDPEDAPFLEVARAYGEGGCSALLETPALEAASRDDERVALLAQRCALQGQKMGLAERLAETWARLRRVTAIAEHRTATEARQGGNRGGSLMHLRRAVAANPAHGPAVADLARALHARGQKKAAADVLRAALDAAEGLAGSTAAITSAAAQLHIRLGAPEKDAASPSSLAPQIPELPGMEAATAGGS